MKNLDDLNNIVANYVADTIDNYIEQQDDILIAVAEEAKSGRDAKVCAVTEFVENFNTTLNFSKKYSTGSRWSNVCNICPTELEDALAHAEGYVDFDA